ncbi:MAG TPA: Crp/Fnr family transcriptional regulator [Gemmatimonadaceae bacterium]|nr:Crp/Fnr family transcriptional regulator [Gemmatimonadaceae bacterium]
MHDSSDARAPRDGGGNGDGTHAGFGSSRAVGNGAAEQTGLQSNHAIEPNALLRTLPFEEYRVLSSHLTIATLRIKQVLIEPRQPISELYFPRVGVCSILSDELEGGTIEVGTIGPEGFIGIPVLLGAQSMPFRVICQIEGDAWRIGADQFRRLIDERPVLRRHLLRFTQYFTDQLSQSVACNRLHTLEERSARWVLMTHDRVHKDTFEMTQEFLSMMLGVHRPAVSVVMGVLQHAGILRYSRGRVRVLDRERLEAASCECYRVTREERERLLGSFLAGG